MKKFLLALGALISINAFAVELEEGKQYIQVSEQASQQPEVVEFFSFYCPHCYDFELRYKIPAKVKAALPANTKFKQYHVNFLGAQSENLTQAWALAMALGVEDQVKKPLFEAAQADSIRSMRDIRQIFLYNGVTAEQFDNGIDSFAVKSLVSKQTKAAEDFDIHGVPDFYINGKYRVNMQGLSQDEEQFINDYVTTITGLLKKDGNVATPKQGLAITDVTLQYLETNKGLLQK